MAWHTYAIAYNYDIRGHTGACKFFRLILNLNLFSLCVKEIVW